MKDNALTASVKRQKETTTTTIKFVDNPEMVYQFHLYLVQRKIREYEKPLE